MSKRPLSEPTLPCTPREADEEQESSYIRSNSSDLTRERSVAVRRGRSLGLLPALGARCDRVEQKVRIATLILDHLPEDDPQARLLRVAVVRRDELLLDAVLTTLQGRDLTRA
jgi:hypothetical protein